MNTQINPFTVAPHLEASQLHTIDVGDPFPAEVVAAIMKVKPGKNGRRRVIQIAGGCNFGDPATIAQFLLDTGAAFEGANAAFISGGTRNVQYDDNDPELRGTTKAMITELVPGICAANPGCVGIGSFPRIGVTEFINVNLKGGDQHAFLRLDRAYGDGVNLGYHINVQVQEGADGNPNDWAKDLDARYRCMLGMEDQGVIEVHCVFANGGGVTKKEIGNCLNHGWRVFMLAGTGRAVDGAIADLAAGTKDNMPTLAAPPTWVDFRKDGYRRDATAIIVDSSTLREALFAYGALEYAVI